MNKLEPPRNLAEERTRALRGAFIGDQVVFKDKIHLVESDEDGRRYPVEISKKVA